jgi:hypothetical protein
VFISVRRHGRRAAFAALLATCLTTAFAGSAQASRGIPIGIYNVNNQVVNSSQYAYAVRFVLDRDTPIYRFISGFNMEGTDYVGGRQGYSKGDGGVIRARLVAVKPNGEPDLSNVLGEETVNAVQRYKDARAAYGAPGITQLLYFNMGGVTLTGGRMYAMVYTNVSSNPGSNWFSTNSPTIKESLAGPNAINNLNPDATGAVAGLDPREAAAWSTNSGGTWVWGRRVGEGNTPGAYSGSSTSDDGTRLPWYGWQTSSSATPQSNQPYYAYTQSGSYTVRHGAVPREVTLTEAGGYAPVGASVGVITVRNTSTGETAQTASLGGGMARGTLDKPLTIHVGEGYELTNSGTVLKQEGDSFIQSTFKVGTGAWPFTTVGQGADRAELFALPYPFFETNGSGTAPAPAPTPTPTPTPAPTPTPSNSAPYVHITKPTDGASFTKSLDITTTASDDHGITKIVFKADGSQIGSDTTYPYTHTWSPNGSVKDGKHTLTAVAYDAAGLTYAHSVTVWRGTAPAATTARARSAATKRLIAKRRAAKRHRAALKRRAHARHRALGRVTGTRVLHR